MQINNCIEFEVTKGDNLYTFHMPAGAPFGEIYDAAFEVLSKVTQLAQEAAQKAAPKELSDAPKQD